MGITELIVLVGDGHYLTDILSATCNRSVVFYGFPQPIDLSARIKLDYC
jgi:hypothetical protein